MVKNPLVEKIKKSSTNKYISIMNESEVLSGGINVCTDIPMMNVALSGSIDRGITCGHTMIAGKSKHFKTKFALEQAKSYLNKYDDGILVFFDSEFGAPESYFKASGIDTSKVIHVPIDTIEELKIEFIKMLGSLSRGDHVIFIIDSIGNIASMKEINDALEGKVSVDMTRAKVLKSLFRAITSKIKILDMPLITINHIYASLDKYSKDVVGGGTGGIYSADNIWIIGRQQDKDGKEIIGYDFIINVEKSRFLKEGSRIPISVKWDSGIQKWSGLKEIACDGGFVIQSGAWYSMPESEKKLDVLSGKKFRWSDIEKEIGEGVFWEFIFENTNFKKYVEERFMIDDFS